MSPASRLAERPRSAGTGHAAAGWWRVVIVLLLTPVVYSYVTTMLRPSSLPLGIRSVEWVRTHHGAWLVNEAEHVWYTWHAPRKGGPPLRTLPTVGVGADPPHANARCGYRPPRIAPVIRPSLPGEGVWRSTQRVVAGAPPVLVTTFRTDPVYPRIVAYVAWFDHTRTQLALYPGRYEPPNASPRGPMEVPPDAALAAAGDVQQRLHVPRQPRGLLR